MKVIFMGTPDFSVGTLEALVRAGHEVVLAVTQPDKPKGRGKEVSFSPVKEKALELGIPVFQPRKIREKESVLELGKYEADVMVVIAFGQILPKEILTMTRYGCINVHASLLPKYRGAAPIQWAVIEGERASGVTTMQMDEGLDTGDMIEKAEVVLDAKETGGSLHDKLAAEGAKLCVSTLDKIEKGTAVFTSQGESPTAYAKQLDKKLGEIDWTWPADKIERLIRGLNPWPSAYTMWEDKVMKLWEAEVVREDSELAPGTIVRVEKKAFCVQIGKGMLRALAVQIPGKKRMETGAFLRGYHLEEGSNLGNTLRK